MKAWDVSFMNLNRFFEEIKHIYHTLSKRSFSTSMNIYTVYICTPFIMVCN